MKMKTLLWIFLFLSLPPVAGYAQTGRIVGTVTDSTSGESLPGVNVVIAGTQQGSATGADGRYTISDVTPGTYDLRASFVGYDAELVEDVEVVAGETTVVDIALQRSALDLNEVVVVGYGTEIEQKSLTGSVASVEAEELTYTNASTVSDALAGKVAGVNFRKDTGRPGASTQLQIRNMGNPLYVIDGVPTNAGDFNNLDFNDIASISILKDAAAASIYGMRAANGVVLVTTKSGRPNQDVQINVNTYFALQDWTRFPEPASAAAFYFARAQSDVNLTGATDRTMEEYMNWKQGGDGYIGTNWLEFATSPMPAPQTYIDVSASGGTEDINFYTSVSHLGEQAVFRDFSARGPTFERTNLQLNVDARPAENLSVSARLNARIEVRQHPGLPGGDDYFAPLWGIMQQWPTFTPYANPTPEQPYGNPEYPRTTNRINSNHGTLTYDVSGLYTNEWRVVNPKLKVEYEIIEGLTASGSYAYQYAHHRENTFEYTYDTYSYDEETDEYIVTGGNQNPYRDRVDHAIEERNLQAQLSFNRSFGVHTITSDLVFEKSRRKWHLWYNKSSPPTNEIPLFTYDALDRLDDQIVNEARMGFALRTNYNYDDRYLLTVAGRYDGSYKFAPGERWGLFPSVALGWRISNESFYEGTGLADVLTFLKIRASYGQVGDDDFNGPAPGDGIGDFRYLSGYNFDTGASSVFNGQPVIGIGPRDQPEANITWLTSTMANVGVDFGLWNGKLSGAVDAFYRKKEGLLARRFDVLVPVEVDVVVGRENLNANATMGIEGSLQYVGTAGDLLYTIGGNATYARTRGVTRYNARFASSWDRYRRAVEGRWLNINWGQQIIGQFQSQEQINNYPVDIDGEGNSTLLPGDFIYKDVNGDGVIDGLDARPIGFGNPGGNLDSPLLSVGLNGSFQYKGIHLRFGFEGGTGFTYERRFEVRNPFQANGNLPAYMINDSWRRKNPFDQSGTDEWLPGTYPPVRLNAAGLSSWRDNDFWVVNVTYLRLSNLQLGYTLPEGVIGALGAEQLNVYARVRNLFSLDNMRPYGLDPVNAGTGNSGNGIGYPQLQEFTLGMSLTI